MLREHLSRGQLDDPLIRDAVSHRLEVAIDAVGRITEDLLRAEAPDDWPKIVGGEVSPVVARRAAPRPSLGRLPGRHDVDPRGH